MSNIKKLILGIASIVLLAVVIVFGVLSSDKDITGNLKSIFSKNTETEQEVAVDSNLAEINKRIARQSEVDAMLLAELESGNYTLDNPLIVVDPYDCSPLTAVVVFNTENESKISIHVEGDTSLADVDFTFDDYGTDHIIPVYGLYADRDNSVTLTATTKSNSKEEVDLTITTSSLNKEVNELIIASDLAQPSKYQPGFTFCFRTRLINGKSAFDVNADVRWFLECDYQSFSIYDYNGNMLFYDGSDYENGYIIECNPLGKIYKVMYAKYGIHHDLCQIDEDTLLTTGSSTPDKTVEDIIVAINTETGEEEDIMDLKTIFHTARDKGDVSLEDPFHLNAIVQVEDTNDILLSLRSQNAVARISWPDGEIKWIICQTKYSTPMYDPYRLTPIGDDFEYFYTQHAPYIMEDLDDNPDTIDILLFDNGRTREQFEDDITADDVYSRLVHYRIDEVNMTIEQIGQFGKEYGLGLFSNVRGDANVLPNGNWMGLFDVNTQTGEANWSKAPAYVEVDENMDIVWMMQITTYRETENDIFFAEYRTERMEIYNSSANDLRIGEDAINLIN